MEGILRVGMGIILCSSLCTCLRSSAVGGGEDILRTELKSSAADPVNRPEPGECDPEQQHDVDPE